MRTFVRVRYSFFLVALLMALRRTDPLAIVMWLIAVFIAVLVHELGHAMAARFYRQVPQIELYAMGGVTEWRDEGRLRWYERIAISFSGPGLGFVIGGLVLAAGQTTGTEPYYLQVLYRDFLWATLGWGLFNLLPIMPLDGGQIVAELLERWRGAFMGRTLARQVSFVFGVLGLFAAATLGQMWAGVLCGFLAYDNLQRMRGLPGVQLPR
jgi:Zn-dependent protease